MKHRVNSVPLPSMRVTRTLLHVLAVLVSNHPQRITGAEICRQTGILSGTVYPLLIRLKDKGWLYSEDEDIDPVVEGRPKRKFYFLTSRGSQEAKKLLEERSKLLEPVVNPVVTSIPEGNVSV